MLLFVYTSRVSGLFSRGLANARVYEKVSVYRIEKANIMTDFTPESFVQDMRTISAGANAARELRAYMDGLFAAPETIAAAFTASPAGDIILFEDETVSVWRTSFDPGVSVPAHDHQLSAVIGVYQGSERNDFFESDPSGGLQRSSHVDLGIGDVLSIGPSAIHSVTCISEMPCLGLHVYLGNLTKVSRTLFDIDNNQAMPFDEANYEKLMSPDRF